MAEEAGEGKRGMGIDVREQMGSELADCCKAFALSEMGAPAAF